MRQCVISKASMVKFKRKLCKYQCLVIYLLLLFASTFHPLVDDTLMENTFFLGENVSGIMMLESITSTTYSNWIFNDRSVFLSQLSLVE